VEVNSFAEELKLLRNCPTAEFFHHEELGSFDIDLRKWSCSSAAAAISAAPSLMLPIEVVFWIGKSVSVCYCQNPFLFFFFFCFFFFLAVDDPQLQQLHLKLHP
jgi:hypothetical protein